MRKKNGEQKRAVIHMMLPHMDTGEDMNLDGKFAEEICLEYAQKHGYEIVGVFRDTGSNEEGFCIHGYELMFDFIGETKKVDAVIAYEPSKLMWTYVGLPEAKSICKRLGVELIVLPAGEI